MTAAELLAGGGGALIAVLTLLEIAPIRIKPWAAIARALGRAINADLAARVETLGDKVDTVERGLRDMQAGVDERNAVCCRVRILRFGDEVLHGVRHSKDHFDQVLEDITTYDHYCGTHPDFRNNMTQLTAARIKEIYIERLEKNDFL